MAIIRVKRSTGSTAPGANALKNSELAYTMGGGTQGNGGARLYIGQDSGGVGVANSASVIGGKYFTDMLDHVAGVNTASSALIVDASKKLDELAVDFISLNNSTINSTGTNDLNLVPAAGYSVAFDNQIKIDSDNIIGVGSIAVGQITGLTSDLIPNADSAISLGSASKKWKDLYLSAGSLYMGTLILSDSGGDFKVTDSAGNVKLDGTAIDGTTSATATTVIDADRVVMNDGGVMKQVAVTDLAAYFDDEITAMPNLTTATALVTTAATTVGVLNAGSITSGFGSIDVGADSVTTTGTMTAGKVVTDNITVDANTISSTNTNGNIVISPHGSGSIDVATTKIIGVTDPTDSAGAASKNYVDTVLDLQDLDIATDSGTIDVDLDDETLTIAGGTGIGSVGSGTTVTLNIDATVATLTGSQTLTNKTLTTPNVSNPNITPSATAAGTIEFKEGTNNGTNRVLLQGPASTADATLTLPAATDTLVGKATTDTFTNKTFDADGTGNSLTNIEVANLKSGVLDADITAVSTNDDTLPSAKAVKTYVDATTINVVVGADSDTFNLLDSDMIFAAGEGMDVALSGNTVTFSGEDATVTNKGVASFATANFAVSSGAVTTKATTIGSTAINAGGTSTVLAGLTQVDVDNVRILDNTIASSSGILYIDPTPIGTDSGDVVIRGNLQVNGIQTIINSTVTSINDLNMVLADSAVDAAAADGAGLTIGGAGYSGTKAVLSYNGSNDEWEMNKTLNITTGEFQVGGVSYLEAVRDNLGGGVLVAGEGLDIAIDDGANTITYSAETATKNNLGVASFDSAGFGISSGHITLTQTDITSTGALNAGTITAGFGNINNGASAITTTGDITGGGIHVTGDVTVGDDGALGYTAAEGLILTGQGSTYDVTVKNDSDATVAGVPTGTTNLRFPDNSKATFGTSDDLQIYHDASNSYVSDAGTGSLKLTGSVVEIEGSGETLAKFTDDGAAELYYDNSKKIETTSAGATVTGTLAATLSTVSQPNVTTAAALTTVGALNAGSITSGFTSIDVGAGAITTTGIITGGKVTATGDTDSGDNSAMGYTAAEGLILTGQGSTNDITFKNDSDVTVMGIPTGTHNLRFPDGNKTTFGASDDLQIYHDASHSYITDGGTGNLKITASQLDILGTGETMATFVDDGAVTLYHDNSAKFATSATGATITGTATLTEHLQLADSKIAKFGGDADLEIYSDDSDGYIKQGKGALRIATSATGVAVKIGHTTSETTINDNFTVVGTANFGAITTSSTTLVTNLNADQLDGQSGAYYRINVYNSGGSLLN